MFRPKQTIAALLASLSCSFSILPSKPQAARARTNEKEPENVLQRHAEYFARQHGTSPTRYRSCPVSEALRQLEDIAPERESTAPGVAATKTGALRTSH